MDFWNGFLLGIVAGAIALTIILVGWSFLKSIRLDRKLDTWRRRSWSWRVLRFVHCRVCNDRYTIKVYKNPAPPGYEQLDFSTRKIPCPPCVDDGTLYPDGSKRR